MMNKYRHWLWVFYPIGVVVLIIISLNVLLSADTNKLVEANLKRKQAMSEAEKVANLKTKLEYLNGIDQTAYIDDLKYLLTAIPASKKPWLTLAEMNLAASRAGIAVSDFFGTIGEIKEASEAGIATGADPELYVDSKVRVSDFSVLRRFFEELNKLKPLVSALSLKWSNYEAIMEIDVSYSPWPRFTADPEGKILENKEEKRVLMEKLKEYEDIDPLVVYLATDSGELEGEVSPF